MASKLPMSASKLPTPGSRLRPPTKLQLPSSLPHGKRRASDDGDLNPSPSKRSRGNLKESSSSLSLAADENEGTTVMGPPSTVLRRPGAAAASVGRSKLRRSVSMANITVSKNVRTGAVPSRGFGSTLTRSNSKLSGSNISLTGRPSSATTRAPVSGPSSARRPGTNITSKVNNVPPPGAARAPPARKPVGVTAPAPEKGPMTGRSKRPAWDMKGRLQDTEEMLRQLTEMRQNDQDKLSEFSLKLNELHQEKQNLNFDLMHSSSASQEKQAQLEQLQSQLRDLERSSQGEKMSLQSCIRRVEEDLASRERSIKQLTSDLDIKIDEISNLKRTVSESLGARSLVEAKLSSVSAQLRSSEDRVQELSTQLADALDQVAQLKQAVLQGESLRKQLHNRVQELKGNIRVYCRIRPLLAEEIKQNGDFDDIRHINVLSESSLELLKGNAGADTSSMSGLRTRGNGAIEFTYDRVFGPKDSQLDVFKEVSQLVQSALDGYNVCVFAYGQTGSGKTYTMEGGEAEHAGIIPRTVDHIFTEISRLADQGWEYKIAVSFLEIYNESIRDLLAAPEEAKSLTYDIRLTDPKSPHTHVTNLKVVCVSEREEIYELLHTAQQHRAVAATNMNQHSSRSHSVFRMVLSGAHASTSTVTQGSLNLVDLAGSERLKESGSQGARLTETQNINKSLSNLGNVIMARGQKQNHVPYRNSKLTHLLQPSLEGNSKTLMLVNVSPLDACLNETVNSLRFASKVNACHLGTASKHTKKV